MRVHNKYVLNRTLEDGRKISDLQIYTVIVKCFKYLRMLSNDRSMENKSNKIDQDKRAIWQLNKCSLE